MGNATSSTRKISAQDRAVYDLKTQRDKLHQYQKRITALTSREHAIARELLAQHTHPKPSSTMDPARARALALLALRRKKFQETLLARTDAQLAQLEQLAAEVEFARIQADVLFGLRQGTAVLREIQRELGGVEGVERLMGENAEAVAYQTEISDMLRNRMSAQEEDEVEDELSALQAELSASQLPATPQHAEDDRVEERLPDVPAAQEEVPARAKAGRNSAQAAEPLLA